MSDLLSMLYCNELPLEEAMNPKIFAQAVLAACTLALALNVGAQTPGNNASKPATEQATAAGAASAKTGQSSKTTTSKHRKHHAASHKSSDMQNKPMAARPAGSQETAYQMALRHCVEGPMGQRDTCLDSAIARYGRS